MLLATVFSLSLCCSDTVLYSTTKLPNSTLFFFNSSNDVIFLDRFSLFFLFPFFSFRRQSVLAVEAVAVAEPAPVDAYIRVRCVCVIHPIIYLRTAVLILLLCATVCYPGDRWTPPAECVLNRNKKIKTMGCTDSKSATVGLSSNSSRVTQTKTTTTTTTTVAPASHQQTNGQSSNLHNSKKLLLLKHFCVYK